MSSSWSALLRGAVLRVVEGRAPFTRNNAPITNNTISAPLPSPPDDTEGEGDQFIPANDALAVVINVAQVKINLIVICPFRTIKVVATLLTETANLPRKSYPRLDHPARRDTTRTGGL